MPIIGTPVTPVTPGADVNDQSVIRPGVTSKYDKPMPLRRRAVLVHGGQSATLAFQMFTRTALPADLSLYGVGLPGPSGTTTIELRCREAVDPSAPLYKVTMGVDDPASGLVSGALPNAMSSNYGVYHGEIGVLNGNGTVAFRNQLYVWVDRGLFGTPVSPAAGPPQLEEVRLFLADSDPAGNLLLDDLENDLALVCQAAERAVRYWNESQPPIDLNYTTITYPYRDHWLKGILGYLYTSNSYGFLRNHLPYQAAGVSVDDQNKFQQYAQIADTGLQEYKEWVKQKKAGINCEAGITSFGSPYGAGYWY